MEERIRNSSVVIGTTSTLIREALYGKVKSKALTVVNTSTAGQIITISVADEAVAGIGIVLYPTGAWSETLDPAFSPTNERIYAVSSAALGNISVHERILSGD
jgi:hypothetical protein